MTKNNDEQSFMLHIKGKRFYCAQTAEVRRNERTEVVTCACGLFTKGKPFKGNPIVYVCNACGTEYEGEK